MHRNREKEREREREIESIIVSILDHLIHLIQLITLPGVEWAVLLVDGLLLWAAAPVVLGEAGDDFSGVEVVLSLDMTSASLSDWANDVSGASNCIVCGGPVK